MSKKIVVRSGTDNHVLFSSFMSYYADTSLGSQTPINHCHPDPEISAIMGGSGIYTCSGVDYPFQTGDVFFHCGNDPHYFSRIDDSFKLSLVVLRFDTRLIWSPSGEWTSPVFLRLFSSRFDVEHRVPADSAAAKAIYDLLINTFEECRDQNNLYDSFAKANLLSMLAHLSRHFYDRLSQQETPQISETHIKSIEETMNYILSNLESDLSLNSLASRACMSRSYYSSIFKELNGISVGEYISYQRLEKVKYKLQTTNLPVLEIAEQCGFNSITNFNRAFKKYTGKTPGEYRSERSKIRQAYMTEGENK